MLHRSSRSVYEARMHRVLAHIDANLAEDLDLEAFAAVASFSRHRALLEASRYGVSHDDPSITPAPKCRYGACVAIAAQAVLRALSGRRSP